MTRGIFIIHTPSQLEQASNLVDLLEASLSIPSGAIVCSSLPGYAWAAPNGTPAERGAKFTDALEGVGAAIALVDATSIQDPQLSFDLACAWSRGKRVALLADSAQLGRELPQQLADAPVATRVDRASIVSMVEDLAFDLGLSPRIGHDAYRALEQLSSVPPPPDDTSGSFENTKTEPVLVASTLRLEPLRDDDFSESETQAGPVPRELLVESSKVDGEELDADDDALQLNEDDVELSELREEAEAAFAAEASPDEPLREHALLETPTTREPAPRESTRPTPIAVSCGLSLEAGRAISECSFHRDENDFSVELENNFGRFIDAVGGNWDELRRLADLDVWLGATDNLLESLPPSSKYISEWYELGFQFSMLRSLAEQGVPGDPEQRAAYEELWTQSMAAFRQSASSARISPRESRRVQALLENLVGPERRRDFSNVARSLHELRALADQADQV